MNKKLLCLLLSLILTLGAFAVFPAAAADTDAADTAADPDIAATGYIDEKEENDSLSDANLMSIGETWRGAISFDWDTDCYKIFMSETGKLTFSIKVINPVSAANNKGCWVNLYGNDYKQFGMITLDGAATATVELPFIGAKAGNYYYVRLNPAYGSPKGIIYEIKASFTQSNYYEKETNQKEATASTLILEDELEHGYTGNIAGDYTNADDGSCYDQDYYHVKVPADGMMRFLFEHKKRAGAYSSSGWALEVYRHDSKGNKLSLVSSNILLNSSESAQLYKAEVKKNEEYWICVKSIQDPDVQSGYNTYHPSDILGEPYTLYGQFALMIQPDVTTSSTSDSVTLTSPALTGITGYMIEMISDTGVETPVYVKKTALDYTKKGLKSNTSYSFWVCAYLKIDETIYRGTKIKITIKTKTATTTGYTVSGTVTSFLSETDPVTIQLLQNGSVKKTATVKGNTASYSLTKVPYGTYTLRVSKKNHVTRDYTFTVSANTTKNLKICPKGDATGDGKVTNADYSRVNQHVCKVKPLTGYELQCADVVGNTDVTNADLARINQHVCKTKPLW